METLKDKKIAKLEEILQELITDAHMAGQHNQAHCDPSYGEALSYYIHEVKDRIASLNEQIDTAPTYEPKAYDIDFGGHCKARISITDSGITVIGAMNGWGCNISDTDIIVTDLSSAANQPKEI